MATEDKARNKGEETKGKLKEKTGEVTGDRELEQQGRRDQSKSKLKQAGEKVKDAIKKA
ncbi:MAG TPA: CsbD family protein [Actinomycetota bacterium]|nr:CsbD family protein [Actinomycetota bacterium]